MRPHRGWAAKLLLGAPGVYRRCKNGPGLALKVQLRLWCGAEPGACRCAPWRGNSGDKGEKKALLLSVSCRAPLAGPEPRRSSTIQPAQSAAERASAAGPAPASGAVSGAAPAGGAGGEEAEGESEGEPQQSWAQTVGWGDMMAAFSVLETGERVHSLDILRGLCLLVRGPLTLLPSYLLHPRHFSFLVFHK